MPSKKKHRRYYVVWVGRKPGVYYSWSECRRQVHGFPESRYQIYPSLELAFSAFQNPRSKRQRNRKNRKRRRQVPKVPITDLPALGVDMSAVFVDAACSGTDCTMEYRAVQIVGGAVAPIFSRGPFLDVTINIGEFLAIVDALRWLHKNQLSRVVFSDSKTAISWVANQICGTRVQMNAANRTCLLEAADAVQWLLDHPRHAQVRKWPTQDWGEIPADYARKS